MASEEFDEEALKRALRAPGSPTELAGEQTYRAMFRAAQPPTNVVVPMVAGRRAVRRLGAGTTLAVVVAMATGGVAAAYSSNLPDPVQRAVHSVLSPLGVPAVEPKRHVVDARERQTPEPEVPTASPAPPAVPSSSPSADRSHQPRPAKTVEPSPSADPSASRAPVLPTETPTETPSSTASTDPSTDPLPSTSPSTAPSTAPSETPSPTTSPTPPATPPAPVPATVSITSAGADSKVAPGGTAVVTGRVVAADGTPVPDVRVFLKQLGASGWQRIASARTGADGSVAVATGPVQRSTQLRFRAGKVRSVRWSLKVQPSVTATAQTVGRVSTVTVGVNGAQPGDQLLLVTTRSGLVVQEGAASLTASGAVRFEITAPSGDSWYVVQLPATAGHAAAQVRVLVRAALPDES